MAVVHGILVERLMVRPLATSMSADDGISGPVRRLVPALLHFSTICWFLGGLTLVAAALFFDPEARLATSLFVGGTYLFGAVVNLWATRGRHFGWMLMAAAVILIFIGMDKLAG